MSETLCPHCGAYWECEHFSDRSAGGSSEALIGTGVPTLWAKEPMSDVGSDGVVHMRALNAIDVNDPRRLT